MAAKTETAAVNADEIAHERVTTIFRPKSPEVAAEAPGNGTMQDPTMRSAKDRAEAGDYVENLLEGYKVTLVSLAAIYAPIFNPDSMRNREFFDTIHRIEKEIETFKKAVLGSSAMNPSK